MVGQSIFKTWRSSHPFFFFSKKEKERIICAIREAEKRTSGEIRVHLVRRSRKDLLSDAKKIFQNLRINLCKERNGVLIVLDPSAKKFVVIGDRGIHEKVNDDFWIKISSVMEENFKQNRFADGIVRAVETIGQELQNYFPRNSSDINELRDEISISL